MKIDINATQPTMLDDAADLATTYRASVELESPIFARISETASALAMLLNTRAMYFPRSRGRWELPLRWPDNSGHDTVRVLISSQGDVRVTRFVTGLGAWFVVSTLCCVFVGVATLAMRTSPWYLNALLGILGGAMEVVIGRAWWAAVRLQPVPINAAQDVLTILTREYWKQWHFISKKVQAHSHES